MDKKEERPAVEGFRASRLKRSGTYYRRSGYKRPYRNVRGTIAEDSTSYLETIIFQCIVCGIILCASLLICVIKTPSALSLRKDVKQALTENIDPESVGNDSRGIQGIAAQISTSVRNIIFGAEETNLSVETEPDLSEGEAYETIENNSLNDTAEDTVPVFENTDDNKDFRIDEEMLDSIYDETGQIIEEPVKNTIVP